jgi:hypothetical protein
MYGLKTFVGKLQQQARFPDAFFGGGGVERENLLDVKETMLPRCQLHHHPIKQRYYGRSVIRWTLCSPVSPMMMYLNKNEYDMVVWILIEFGNNDHLTGRKEKGRKCVLEYVYTVINSNDSVLEYITKNTPLYVYYHRAP